MTIEHGSMAVAVLIGATTAIGQVVTHATTTSVHPLIVPVVSAVIGGAVSYGVLKTTVQRMEQDMQALRTDLGNVYDLLREALTKIAHMEGRLEAR